MNNRQAGLIAATMQAGTSTTSDASIQQRALYWAKWLDEQDAASAPSTNVTYDPRSGDILRRYRPTSPSIDDSDVYTATEDDAVVLRNGVPHHKNPDGHWVPVV